MLAVADLLIKLSRRVDLRPCAWVLLFQPVLNAWMSCSSQTPADQCPCYKIWLYQSINHISSHLFPLLRLRQLDIEFMKHLSRVVNIIPVIAKSDTLTLEEKIEFKQRVRMKDGFTGWFIIKLHWLTRFRHNPLQVRKELEVCGIECYPQKEFDEDMEDKSDNDKIRVRSHFSHLACCSFSLHFSYLFFHLWTLSSVGQCVFTLCLSH